MTHNETSIPKHLAIIMDGNGRWAKDQGKPRFLGHEKGVGIANDIVKHCAQKLNR